MLTEDQEKTLWINRNRRGWRTQEPLDDKLLPEEPSLIPRGIEMLIDDGDKRREQIASDLALPTRDLEEIACLPPGYFSAPPAAVVPLPRRREDTGRAVGSDSGDNVIDFTQLKRP
jgi:hypothetical protein